MENHTRGLDGKARGLEGGLRFCWWRPDVWMVMTEVWKLGPDVWKLQPEVWMVGPDVWNVEPNVLLIDPEVWTVRPEVLKVGPEVWIEGHMLLIMDFNNKIIFLMSL